MDAVRQDLFISTFCVADFRSVNVKIRMEKNAAVIHLPGFKYDDFDRAGILTVYFSIYVWEHGIM